MLSYRRFRHLFINFVVLLHHLLDVELLSTFIALIRYLLIIRFIIMHLFWPLSPCVKSDQRTVP